MRHILAALAISLLSACGSSAQPVNVCMQPSDRLEPMRGCDATVWTINEPDPVKSVAMQASVPGPMVLWPGHRRDWARSVVNFPALITEAAKYPGKFPWVTVYDEPGWCNGQLCYWADEALVMQGVALAHAHGIKTLITVMPDVILDPRFAIKNINAFDGIAIDVYPSIRPTVPNFGACRWNDNPVANLFYCAAQKLRALGYVGQIGYMPQGFGMVTDTHAHRMEYLTQQRYVMGNAGAMGADAQMVFGCHLGAPELAAEPVLVPLCGTPYESLVTP
jgi:hypothetical protein